MTEYKRNKKVAPRAHQKFFIRRIQTQSEPLYIPFRFYCGNASIYLCVCDAAFVFAIIGIFSLFPLGARVFVLTSLFALQDSWRWTCFIPPFLGFFASWLLSVKTGLRKVIEACAKTLLLPPSDVAGIVPSALYVIVYGAAVLAGKDSSTFVELLIVLFIHSVSGCLWEYILDKKYKVD